MGVQFFYAWAWSSVDVLRPALRASLGLTLVEAGAAYSAQVVGALAAALLIGQLEHAFGRRHLMAAATAGFGATLIAGALVDNWPMLLLQRLLLGWFAGAVFPLTVGTIVDLFSASSRGKLASLVDATYFLAVIALGAAAALVPLSDWRLVLVAGGVPPLLFAAGVYVLVPPGVDEHRKPAGDGWRDMHAGRLFSENLRARTIALAAIIGATSSGAQAFSGWLTTYLAEIRQLSPDEIGIVLSFQFGASAVGAFVWGWVVDSYGRRAGAAGMIGAAAAVTAFLLMPWGSGTVLAAAAYGFCFSAVVSYGPWIAELYPPHLRSSATSIFQWGRFISLFSPLITGALAGLVGLAAAMGLAAVLFLIAAWIWLRLPETLESKLGD